MITRNAATPVALLAAVTLAACGGGGGGHVLPSTPTSAPTSGATSSPQAITQPFAITVPPAGSTSATIRRPKYVSPNTGSIRIVVQSVNGQPAAVAATVAPISATAAGCTSGTAGVTCTVNALAAVGSDVFAISTYASSDGSGTALATTTIAETVAASGNVAVALSLGGVPSAIAFSPTFLPLEDDGAIHRYPVTVNAVDASGAAIVGASAYQSAVSLQIINDPTHALSLSTASVTQPGTVVTVTFDGSKSLVQATIQAAGTGVASIALNAAPLRFTPAALTVYDDSTAGASTTITQAGFTGAFTATVANTADATATLAAGALGTGSAVVTVLPHTIFDVTSLNVSNGIYSSTLPVTVLPHPSAYQSFGNAHQLLQPASLVEAPNGVLWTADAGSGSVVSFDPSSGTYAEYVVDPSDAGPTAVAFDSNGLLWFADGSQIGSFNTTTQAVTDYTTGLAADARVANIVPGAPGSMWFYDEESNNPPAGVGQPSSFGTIATATGAIHEFTTPDEATPIVGFESMALGPDGALWYADGSGSAIGRVTTGGSYSSVVITSPNEPNLQPEVVVTGPDGNIWFGASNLGLAYSELGTVNPSTKALAHYSAGVAAGNFNNLIVGSDHNLWFGQQVLGTLFFSSQADVGVLNPTTHAAYEYTSITPDETVPASLVDRGDRTLWILDNAFGNIGKVAFK